MSPDPTDRVRLRSTLAFLILALPALPGCSAIMANAVRARKVERFAEELARGWSRR